VSAPSVQLHAHYTLFRNQGTPCNYPAESGRHREQVDARILHPHVHWFLSELRVGKKLLHVGRP